MKKALTNRLREIASGLPDLPQMKPHVFTGQDMIDSGAKKDADGKKIDKKATYAGWKEGKVDHYKRVKEAYNRGGDDAVSEYCADVLKQKSELNRKAREKESKKHTEKVI